MIVHLGQTIHLDFATTNPSTAAAATASAVTVRVFEDASDTAILTPTATERTAYTGNYRVPVACTTANGFEVGKSYNVVVEATVGGVTARGVVGSFVLAAPVYYGTVVADGGNTATTFCTDLADVTGHWVDCFCTFVTGSLAGQTKPVSAFNGTTDFLTAGSAFTAAPSAGDRFILVDV